MGQDYRATTLIAATYLLVAVVSYLVGAFPTGMVVARLWGNVDLRKVGSRRTGASNVLRTVGPVAGAVVFAGDFAKGGLAVLLAGALMDSAWAQMAAGFAAVIGHNYSIFIGWRGGRGVTTGLAGLLVMSPVAAVLAFATGMAVIALTRYISLGSMLGTVVGLLVVGILFFVNNQPLPHLLYAAVGGAFVIATHRDNVQRLLRGTERRMGEKVVGTRSPGSGS